MGLCTIGIAAAAALAWTSAPADADVICKKKKGSMVIRAACKKKESPVDLASFGAVGPKGDDGAKGDKGDTGDPGPLPTTLPSNATLRGAYVVRWDSGVASGNGDAQIAFPFPLAVSPTAIVVQEGAPTPAGCTGDYSNPGAAPGNLCIFVTYVGGGDCTDFSTFGISDGDADYRFGAVLYAHANSGFCESTGTWAVTAP